MIHLFAAAAVIAIASQPADEARAAFGQYETYTREYDVRLADLYADDAQVVARRGGATRMMRGDQWKALIRVGVPVAKQRGDLDTFSDVEAITLPDGTVRVRAVRFNHLKNYKSPYSAVWRQQGGRWLIVREEIQVAP